MISREVDFFREIPIISQPVKSRSLSNKFKKIILINPFIPGTPV